MKTAFSTLGCPNWSFKEIYATAKDIGFEGIEIRGIGSEMYAPAMSIFAPDRIEETKARFAGRLKISCLTSAACLDDPNCIAEAKDYLLLAAELGVPFVRIMVNGTTYPTDAPLELCAKRYTEICDFALHSGIEAMPLVETNSVLASSKTMREFMDGIDRPNAGVLWDVNHPHRYYCEEVEETAKRLGGYIKYMHVKDSHIENGTLKYRMMGYGDMPIYDALRAAKKEGFDGYVCLEWVKRWMPDLQEPGIVFSHYYNYITYLFGMLKEEL